MPNQRSVLIVDDSRISRMMTKAFIHSLFPGWNVAEATTGEEALIKAPTLDSPLILMDVNMPGMGGLAAAEQLRKLCPGAQITLLTANVQDATRHKAQVMGVGFLEKPVTEERIHKLISAWSN
jgi:two-component system chemotaxis response regulator CheY